MKTLEQSKKTNQLTINQFAENEYYFMQKQFYEHRKYNDFPTTKRLYKCNAYFYSIPGFIILESYATIIAFIDIEKRAFIDVLRFVYGYTSTSNQHMSKFKRLFDYAYDYEYSWRGIK